MRYRTYTALEDRKKGYMQQPSICMTCASFSYFAHMDFPHKVQMIICYKQFLNPREAHGSNITFASSPYYLLLRRAFSRGIT